MGNGKKTDAARLSWTRSGQRSPTGGKNKKKTTVVFPADFSVFFFFFYKIKRIYSGKKSVEEKCFSFFLSKW